MEAALLDFSLGSDLLGRGTQGVWMEECAHLLLKKENTGTAGSSPGVLFSKHKLITI